MRLGQTLSYADLRAEAAKAVRLEERPQYEIAAALGVKPGSLSNALNNEGPRFAKLQMRVLRFLRPEYAFQDVGGFRIVRPAGGEGEAS